jgi:hypothetical protein
MSVAAVESITLVDMLNPFVCVYMAWMVPYTVWLWCGGMYESPDTTGRETSWHAQVRQCICILRIHHLGGCHFSGPMPHSYCIFVFFIYIFFFFTM